MRDTIFVSHANPEDNEFALWLALQLASQGYPTWCDLTKLLGGEDFWSDIESVLRDRAIKFLFVLSHSSNLKPGPQQELSVAQAVARTSKLHDFIIPLKVDNLPHADTNIRLHHLNAIPFQHGWATGLKRLLEKLDQENVPRSQAFSPSAVTEWWRSAKSSQEGLVSETENYLTNWFPICSMPQTVQIHRLARQGGGVTGRLDRSPFPTVKHGAYAISFASANDLRSSVDLPDEIVESEACSVSAFLDGAFPSVPIQRRDAQNHLTNLLRQASELEFSRRGLPIYEFSGGRKCWYFKQGMAERDSVHFVNADGRQAYRQVVGFATLPQRPGADPIKRYWHFGLQLKPLTYPLRAFAAKPHVVFSSNGQDIWDSDRRLHRARRSECKDWWNAVWRDRMLAAMTWLCGESGFIELHVSSEETISVSRLPKSVTSPVSYLEPAKLEAPIDVDSEDEWDDDEHETWTA